MMKAFNLFRASVLALSLISLPHPAFTSRIDRPTVPIIPTTSGLLKGRSYAALDPSNPPTSAYLGIPYAVPPLGPLRFKAPIPLHTPFKIRETTNFSPGCMQAERTTPYEPESKTGFSEDCLTVNVWTTPRARGTTEKKEVMVWIYGGAWVSGTSSFELYNLTNIARSNLDLVFVSINYRINIFGYADTPALSNSTDSNAGLRDQMLALSWVQKNIAAFGGDPDKVTVFGQSAGAGSIGAWLYSHYATTNRVMKNKKSRVNFSDNLPFRAAITMSGTSFLMGLLANVGAETLGQNKTAGFQGVAERAGCPLAEFRGNYDKQLRCMQRVNATELRSAAGGAGFGELTPYPDGELVFTTAEYFRMARAGEFARVPLLSGVVNNEGDFFAIDPETFTLNETLSDFVTNAIFACPDSIHANASSAYQVPTYRYRYLPRFPSVGPPPLRTFHGSELPLLFDTLLGEQLPGTTPPGEAESAASKYLQRAWTAFARDPVEGLERLGWKRYGGGRGGETLMELFGSGWSGETPVKAVNPVKYDRACLGLGLGG